MNDARPEDSEQLAPLPRRRGATAANEPAQVVSPVIPPGLDLKVVEEALHSVSEQEPDIRGVLVASADGLALASHTRGVLVDTVAAMAAAAAGLAAQFTEQAAIGEPRASMFEGSSGFVGVFPVDTSILLVVFGRKDTTMGLFNNAAKKTLASFKKSLEKERMRRIRATRRSLFEAPLEDESQSKAEHSS